MPGVLRDLIHAWRGRDLLSEMLDEFQQMLLDCEWMFRTVGAVLLRQERPETVHDEFFARDREINSREKEIRRRIVEDLSLRREADVPACLVLMSVVKDAERIGDYCKNVYEVACLYAKGFDEGTYVAPLKEVRVETEGLLGKTRAAFAEVRGEAALEVIRASRVIGDRCDDMIAGLIRDRLPTDEAVAYALLFRYFKRIAAHLANICSSVTGPVYEMDHKPLSEQRTRKTYGTKS